MSPIEVLDRLLGGSFTYLECRDGRTFGGIRLNVNFCIDEGNEPACIEVTAEGLILHFNSQDEWGDKRAESVWLSDLVEVA